MPWAGESGSELSVLDPFHWDESPTSEGSLVQHLQPTLLAGATGHGKRASLVRKIVTTP